MKLSKAFPYLHFVDQRSVLMELHGQILQRKLSKKEWENQVMYSRLTIRIYLN